MPTMSSLAFWSFLWDTQIVECVGFLGLAIHAFSPDNHTAFLASFTAFNFTPVFLIVACLMAFDDLVTRHVSSEERGLKTICLPAHLVCPFLVIYELVAAGFIIAGLFHEASFLSPFPISGMEGALARISHQSVGATMLSIGTLIQLACLLLFTWFSVAAWFTWGRRTDSAAAQSTGFAQRRGIFLAVFAVTTLLAFSSAYNLWQYSGNVEREFPRALLDSHRTFALLTASPQLLANLLFASIFSEILAIGEGDPSPLFPEQVASVVLAARLNEKDAVLLDV